ncbi:unnamed protein product [Ceratitis capitata]|uniref:(Mediterranean fruit fly) hypothetical protein n=1 Tax=Ceratitis capitata TaxID=7213 RepID=A0A811V800_CERCA|nr:unnamed protein product [Ceratitis capitata]
MSKRPSPTQRACTHASSAACTRIQEPFCLTKCTSPAKTGRHETGSSNHLLQQITKQKYVLQQNACTNCNVFVKENKLYKKKERGDEVMRRRGKRAYICGHRIGSSRLLIAMHH